MEKWFVDCKHFKKGVPPTELQNLLTWSEAERPDVALLVVSNFLSNASKDYLENYRRNNKPPFKIKYWEKPDLERMVKARLIRKYDLADVPIRSIMKIAKAEEEFYNRVWYDRHQMFRRVERENRVKQKTPKDIMKSARAAARRVEAKYGKKNLGPYSDVEWGMVLGKLSALRWVLGDDWDMLDS